MEIRDKKGLTEEEFLRQYNSDKYPKPSLTADSILFSINKKQGLEVLLIQRQGHPFLGRWAFPGGFANKDEVLAATAARELEEETGLKEIEMKLLDVYSTPGRDPRGWVVSAAYYTVVESSKLNATAADDAADAKWFTVKASEKGLISISNSVCSLEKDSRGCFLAFDHDKILFDAYRAVSNIFPK